MLTPRQKKYLYLNLEHMSDDFYETEINYYSEDADIACEITALRERYISEEW